MPGRLLHVDIVKPNSMLADYFQGCTRVHNLFIDLFTSCNDRLCLVFIYIPDKRLFLTVRRIAYMAVLFQIRNAVRLDRRADQ